MHNKTITSKLVMFVDYHHFEETCMTVCCITLKNGFSVTGQSCSVSPESFDKELGKQFAYKDACNKVIELEAYMVKEADYQAALGKVKEKDYSENFAKRFYNDSVYKNDNGMWDTTQTYN
jgi:hypothetical protein